MCLKSNLPPLTTEAANMATKVKATSTVDLILLVYLQKLNIKSKPSLYHCIPGQIEKFAVTRNIVLVTLDFNNYAGASERPHTWIRGVEFTL